MRYVNVLAIVVSSIFMITCSGTIPKSLGVTIIETKVEKVVDDTSEIIKIHGIPNEKYILIMLTPSHGKFYRISRLRNLKAGDCVKVRVEKFSDGTVFDYGPPVLNCDVPGEKIVNGKVINSWKRGETRFIKVEVTDDFGINDMDFWDIHFKDFNPKDGGCVKVWVYDVHHSDGENLSIIGRNLAPCEN